MRARRRSRATRLRHARRRAGAITPAEHPCIRVGGARIGEGCRPDDGGIDGHRINRRRDRPDGGGNVGNLEQTTDGRNLSGRRRGHDQRDVGRSIVGAPHGGDIRNGRDKRAPRRAGGDAPGVGGCWKVTRAERRRQLDRRSLAPHRVEHRIDAEIVHRERRGVVVLRQSLLNQDTQYAVGIRRDIELRAQPPSAEREIRVATRLG